MGNGSQNGPGESRGEVIFATFSRPCPKVDFWMHFGRPLAHLWLPFGSPLAAFWLLLAHFWCALAHFWRPWDHFCSPLRSIFTLLRSPGVIFNSFWNFRWVSYVNSYFFEKSSLKFSLFVFMFLKYFRQQSTRRQYQGPWHSHSTIFRARSGNLPQATSVLRVFFSIMGSAESRSVNNFLGGSRTY